MAERPTVIRDLAEQARAWEALGFRKLAQQTRLEIDQMLNQPRQPTGSLPPSAAADRAPPPQG